MEILDKLLKELIPPIAKAYLPLIWGQKIEIKEDFIYPGEITQLRPGTKKTGVKMIPQYVVIHDTGMTNLEDDASGLSRYIHAQASSPQGRVASWHFSLDDKECYNHVPTDEQAWHAGDGSNAFGTKYFNSNYQKECIGGGNQNGIGIETCINPDNDYPLTVLRLARLTAELLFKYNLDITRIKQHYDFSGKNCPNVIRSTQGLWEMLLAATKVELELCRLGGINKIEWQISNPNIVKRNGQIITPLKDTEVKLSLFLEIKGKKYQYDYLTLVLGLSSNKRIVNTYNMLITKLIPQVVTSDLHLIIYYPEMDVKISWKSSNEDILSNFGKYYKPIKAQIIILKAHLSTLEETKEFTFEIEVR